MYVSGFSSASRRAVEPDLGELARELRRATSRRAGAPARRPPSSRRCGGCARTRAPGCRAPRRAGRASRRVRPDGTGAGAAVGGSARSADSPRPRPRRTPRPRPRRPRPRQPRPPRPRLLDLLGLGLLDRVGADDVREHRLRVVEERDALAGRRGRRGGACRRSAIRADVELEVLGNLHRQRLDVDLAASPARARRPPSRRARPRRTSSTTTVRLDRLVEPDLLEVDVRDRPADRVAAGSP